MKKVDDKDTCWTVCSDCHGQGRKRQRLRKKDRRHYQNALKQFENSKEKGPAPVRPKGPLIPCINCSGSGIIPASSYPKPDHNTYPHVAIIGSGIGGAALAVACLHRGIPFTLYERDTSFDDRAQGYGLTLQQASKAIAGLGIPNLNEGVISSRHVVHTTQGEIIGEWGNRKWVKTQNKAASKRTNIHVPRQALRNALLKQLDRHSAIQWGHQLIDIKSQKDNSITLGFKVNGDIKTEKATLVVGADGIRSTVRTILLSPQISPLRYLGCIVILGICPLDSIANTDSNLLDSATVFQTANGNERIYIMPFTANSVMWQLSFPISEQEAKALSKAGSKSLKKEAQKRTQWHTPIPQIINATQESQISGYPVYDRELLKPEVLNHAGPVTLIGDAAHPMSPFKGQGANQALLDALLLARDLTKGCGPHSDWNTNGIRKTILEDFEIEMLKRSASKVKDSAAAAKFLHSEIVLHKANEPRGRCLKKKKN
ncbi:FAD-dependent oxidoreductase [Formosa haliotis]|uniref:FAD-dependent oxidoreductase n=1 Tax=Formosa haliotis TaxID=1555194 RepID=UPI0008264ED0|nr:NAD(P)/FAD-dependent oxidoreductase [Formosa haliotis]